jgi:hypothetical protein
VFGRKSRHEPDRACPHGLIMTIKKTIIIINVLKSFRKYVSNIPVNHDVKKQQKTAILGTAHGLRKVPM